MIAKEVEAAMSEATKEFNFQIAEFTVAPQINPKEGLPYHEWFIEFEKEPESLTKLSAFLDRRLQEQNSYYKDLIEGNILKPLVISTVQKEGFQQYMKSIGKLGGQNKIPRLANDRKIADELEKLQQ